MPGAMATQRVEVQIQIKRQFQYIKYAWHTVKINLMFV